MNSIKADLPRTLQTVEIHTLADLHIGDPLSDKRLIKQRIDYIKDTPNAYAILNGDICNWATKNSVSDCYSEKLTPMEQIKEFVCLMGPIADKVISVQPGNHENRSYKTEGIDITEIACREIGLADKYSKTASLLFVRFGELSRGKKESAGTGSVRRACYTRK